MSVQAKILIVDDEPKMVRLLCNVFTATGFKVLTCLNPEAAVGQVALEQPDLIILDVVFPGAVDGYEVCRKIREFSSVPIILLTARVRDADKLSGFDAGADDYVTKPFNSKELVARVRALLKRSMAAQATPEPGEVRLGRLHIDQASHRVAIDGSEVHLTPIEFNLLKLLAQHHDQVMTHEQLLISVWGQEYSQDTEYLRAFIYNLRKKIENDPAHPELIVRCPGIGYSLVTPKTK
ncbi:MAG TPA: response regulator transcription factor [Longilinea sp.]|nr:response regulator transcription factor [Longilinea sp.]